MQEWSDSIKIAVDVIVACVVIVALIVCGRVSRNIMQVMDRERASSDTVREYRVQYMYDDEDCYPQDIVSLILEYQGNPAVVVNQKSGSTLIWNYFQGRMDTDLTSTAISSHLNFNNVYHCDVKYDANGSIMRYEFTEK